LPQKHDTAKFRWGQGFTQNIYHKGHGGREEHKEGTILDVDNNIDFFIKSSL
jgi:hypothetical protein